MLLKNNIYTNVFFVFLSLNLSFKITISLNANQAE